MFVHVLAPCISRVNTNNSWTIQWYIQAKSVTAICILVLILMGLLFRCSGVELSELRAVPALYDVLVVLYQAHWQHAVFLSWFWKFILTWIVLSGWILIIHQQDGNLLLVLTIERYTSIFEILQLFTSDPCLGDFCHSWISLMLLQVRIFNYDGDHSREIYHTKRMQRFV
jgi:hypothetical protein